MELELKHLAAYLPYGLRLSVIKGYSIGEGFWVLKGNETDLEPLYLNTQLTHCKPILRQLSDLTKEIEHNGKKFVPLFELFNCIHDYHLVDLDIENESNISYQIDDGWNHIMSFNDIGLDFGYDQYERRFHLMHDWKCYDFNYIEMHDKLLEWHIDVFDLITHGLAIDINTLKQ